MQKNIVAFVGQNESDVLKVGSKQLMDLVEPDGYRGHIIDLYDPNWTAKLDPIIREGILFAWGCAGIGARLCIDGKNLWDAIHVPFISALADNPAQLPPNHRIPAKFVVNGYYYKEHYDIQCKIIGSPQISARLPVGIPVNPYCNEIPWRKRTHKIVFLKSGGDPEAKRAQWHNWPCRLRMILEESAAEVLKCTTGDIWLIFQRCLEAYGVNLGDRHDILFAMLNEIDWYVRLFKLTKMAKVLCRVDAEIIGARWDHIEKTGIKAKFWPALNANSMLKLFADSKFIINMTPNFSSGPHERVPNGFAAKACVVSDDNDYSKRYLSDIPSYFGFDWADPDWEEKVIAHLESPRVFVDEFQPAFDLVHRDFSGLKVMQTMIDIARMVRFGEGLTNFGY